LIEAIGDFFYFSFWVFQLNYWTGVAWTHGTQFTGMKVYDAWRWWFFGAFGVGSGLRIAVTFIASDDHGNISSPTLDVFFNLASMFAWSIVSFFVAYVGYCVVQLNMLRTRDKWDWGTSWSLGAFIISSVCLLSRVVWGIFGIFCDVGFDTGLEYHLSNFLVRLFLPVVIPLYIFTRVMWHNRILKAGFKDLHSVLKDETATFLVADAMDYRSNEALYPL